MTIEEGLYAFLTAEIDVSTLIGTRLYPVAMPQDPEMPAVVYQRTNATRERAGSGPTGAVEAAYALTCWARTYSEAKALARVVRNTLDGAEGPFGDVQVAWVIADDTRDDFNADLQLFGAVVELSVQYTEG